MKRLTACILLIFVILLLYTTIYCNYVLKYLMLKYKIFGHEINIVDPANSRDRNEHINTTDVWTKEVLLRANAWNYRKYDDRKIDSLSVLGRRLFLHENTGKKCNTKKIIYVYKFGKRLSKRLIKNFGTVDKDPFSECSVSCDISYAEVDFELADAVLFHLHLVHNSSFELKRKNIEQIWVWMADESPYNTLMMSKNKDMAQFNGLFNWSMTYRSTSEVPVPYGRTIPIIGLSALHDFKNMYNAKKKMAAVLGSNCSGRNYRWKYIRRLVKYIDVDIYGGCGRGMPQCPGHFSTDCSHIEGYKFYLSFENSNCLEYITEKLWWNAFEKEAIPVVLGSSKKDYLELLPPHSFIYVEDFRSPEELAKYLLYLSSNETAFNAYHEWRKKFRIVNEHGYFKTTNYHYCRLCEALHYNSRATKVYESMNSYWDKEQDCYVSIWQD